MSKDTGEASKEAKRISGGLIPVCVLIFIIAAQLIYTAFVFHNYKDGFHSDEIWSYGLANSYYQPFIYADDGIYIENISAEDRANFNEWLPGSVMNDYVSVQPGERFSYASVYHNQTLDHHPPLYYILLHTVCSFFPNTFSPYFGFFLNCVFLIVTQIFLFKLSRLIFKSDFYALLVCGFYAAGTGALSTFIFIRQYSLLTMLTVMYTYFGARLFYDEETNLKKGLPPILITAFAAFMTHYYAIIFIGGFTAAFCLWLLIHKKLKKMFIYGGTTLLTLGIFFAAYPAAIMQLSNNVFDGQHIMGYFAQMRYFVMYLLRNSMGIRMYIYKSATPYYILAVLFSLVVISIPLCFLFRNEEWFKKFIQSAKGHLLYIKDMLLKGDRFPIIILLAGITELFVVNKVVSIMSMGIYAQRYIFNIFPFGSLMAVYAVKLLIFILPKIKKYAKPVVAVVVALLAVNIHLIETSPFTIDSPTRFQKISADFTGKNCLFVFEHQYSIAVPFTIFSAYSHGTDNVFYTSYDTIDDYRDDILGHGIDIDYVILNSNGFETNEAQKAFFDKELGLDDTESNDALKDVKNAGVDPETLRLNTERINSCFEGKELVPVYSISANNTIYYVMAVE